MAVSTDSYFSNAIVGTPQVGADIDIYDTGASPKYAVGFGFTRADGCKYRYCHFGAISNRGILVSTDVDESSLIYRDDSRMVALVANYVTPAGETIAPNAIDARYMQVTITATANQFAGAYISITSGTGIGFTYRIKGNTATDDPSTSDVRLDLYDKIVVAVDSNTGFQIAGNPYANLEIVDDSDDRLAAGATVTNNSATDYGWIQTRGVATVLQDAVLPATGDQVFVSSNTDGAIMGSAILATSSNQTFGRVGYCVHPATATYYSCVFLELE